MTTSTKVTKAKKASPKAGNVTETPNVTNILIGFTEPVLKAISTLTATMILQQPHFAGQATQQGLVELSNTMYQFMAGNITVQQAEAAPEGGMKYE